MENIFDFCDRKISSRKTPYKAKRFWDPESGLASLLVEARHLREGHKTVPGKASDCVNRANLGETAFQRALYNHKGKQVLVGEDFRCEIQWADIELPITFAGRKGGRSRRHSVDLIAYAEKFGHFLCELKYARNENAPPANGADYAIFEALIYFGIVKENFVALDNYEVWRGQRLRFEWKDIAKGSRVLVLANSSFWKKAKGEKTRIQRLCREIKQRCGVEVMLYETKDAVLQTRACAYPKKVEPTLGTIEELVCIPAFG
jgi:hypothetical protein